ncbi:MAG: molybdopterin cofactor-binding domain-containing protein [bacterium]
MNDNPLAMKPDSRDPLVDFSPGRREFLKLVGGGIVIFFLAGDEADAQERRRGFGQDSPADFNAYLQIREDGRVTCLTGKVELGQGIVTSLAQMLADELDVPLASVDMVMGDTDRCPFDRGTFGSLSTRTFGPALRAAAAEARGVLLEMAAERLKTDRGRLRTKEGVVFDSTDPQQKVSYAELTRGQAIARRLREKAVLKSPGAFSLMGKSFPRSDARVKVTGQAQYAGDIRWPDMLYAKIVRPPAHGAQLRTIDTAAAEKIEGVRVVRDGDFVAVLAPDPERAGNALKQIRAQFDAPENPVDDQSIFDHLLKNAPRGETAAEGGDLAVGEKESSWTVEKTYLNGYVSHAPIEPHTATARLEGGKITVWASTQSPFGAQGQIAQAVGMAEKDVQVITPFVGGGFGGKNNNQQAVEAARLAKLAGQPVQLMWSREEEFFYDTFRPAAIVKIKAGVTEAGRIALWDYGVYFAGQRGSEHFYDIPHHRTTVFGSGWTGAPGTHPFATGPWRAPSNNTNTFARESHIDILASHAGIDPVEFRLKNLQDERMIRVLNAAAQQFGWTPAPAPSGRGFGAALGIDAGTYVAHLAEIEVDKSTGRIQVKRVVCAQDMGLCVNPEGAQLQMTGCIMMGLGYALTEEIHFQGGQILDLNFNTYEIPRFSWLPQIETVVIEDREAPPQGGGEPAVIGMGAVIANAVHDATGARLLQLPMTPERIKNAL